ncbi:major facilitator superfamily transporter [Diaporthe amygdali]|uniref:major facilitator superfamily transporter n=1 Tax=Phomopsis amygdali TaxID=1214568 RepID=UPI0022FE47B4|nr:major facilitator superfamily transporter [Diaporthe amygdali]KAJ0114436.1 major facilitator superfamily transporter [Diaporthe amygdali]
MITRIVGGVSRLPLAKYIDKFGRVHGFLLAIGLMIAGLIIQALAQNLPTTAVAQIIYGIGWNSIDYVFTVLLADMTSLKNRTLVYGIYVTPTIATSFAAPNIAELLHVKINWRWAFGASALTLVATCLPLTIVLIRASRVVQSAGRASGVVQSSAKRNLLRTLRSLVVEVDVPGITLSTAGLCLLFLSFTLAPTFENGWKSARIITMLVLGLSTIIGFVVWEKWFATVTFMPWTLMRNRNILGGCLVGFASVGSVGIWDAYYGSYLQVVHNQSITTAGYITNTYPLAFAISAPLFGILLFMCQAFIGISERILTASSQMSAVSSIEHDDVAVAIGIWGAFLYIGGALGLGISGAIWSNVFPGALEAALPQDSEHLAKDIFGSLDAQKHYPMGSSIRNAVISAYWAAQQNMVITSICVIPVAIAGALAWKNVNVKKHDESETVRTRGVVW